MNTAQKVIDALIVDMYQHNGAMTLRMHVAPLFTHADSVLPFYALFDALESEMQKQILLVLDDCCVDLPEPVTPTVPEPESIPEPTPETSVTGAAEPEPDTSGIEKLM